MTVKEKCIVSYLLGEEKLNRIVFRGDDKKNWIVSYCKKRYDSKIRTRYNPILPIPG